MRGVITHLLLLAALGVVLPAIDPSAAESATGDPRGEATPQTTLVRRGATILDFVAAPAREYDATSLEPAVPPEGDYMGWPAFTPNGDRVLVTNRLTNNVTVFDWATKQAVANVAVGVYPAGIAVASHYAVVACAFGNQVDVIDLNDYSVAASFPTGEQPWVVRTSPDGRYAYVACDIDDVCEVIDLQTLSHVRTISGFPIFLMTYSWVTDNGRYSATFNDFEVSPDGAHLIVGDGEESVLFFNTTTGAIDYTVPGITDCVAIGLSGDGTKAVAITLTDPGEVHQIDLASHALTSTVILTGYSISMAYEVAVDPTGAKAYVGISNNRSAIVRFASSDFVTFSSTYTPFWIGVSPDHRLAISGQTYFSVVDFATETVLGQSIGNAQCYGAVSPADARVASFDPLRHEGVYFYDYSNPAAPLYRGTTESGLTPEGDAPRRVAVTPDGRKAVVTNLLSGNAAIVNLETYELEALLPIGDHVQDVAITSDGLWAVVCGWESGRVKVLDLSTNTSAAEVPAGGRPGVVTITPDDHYAYVGNISSNTISVIELAGPASHKIVDIPCGEIGASYAAYTVCSDVKASPNGSAVLVAVSFDDQVKVIDTATRTIVAVLHTGDFPLQIAFNGAGDHAIATNFLGDSYTVMHIAGAASSVVGTFSVGGDGPLRLAYNPLRDEIGIGYYSSLRLVRVVPETGAYLGYESYSGYGALTGVEYDPLDGGAIVLTQSAGNDPGHVHRSGEAVLLPAVPAFFDYAGPDVIIPTPDRSGSVAAVVMPGPDWLTVIRWEASEVRDLVTIPLSAQAFLQAPRPNPVYGCTQLTFELGGAAQADLRLLDVTGRSVATIVGGTFAAGEHSLTWQPNDLPAGVYQMILRLQGRPVASRKVFVLGAGD